MLNTHVGMYVICYNVEHTCRYACYMLQCWTHTLVCMLYATMLNTHVDMYVKCYNVEHTCRYVCYMLQCWTHT